MIGKRATRIGLLVGSLYFFGAVATVHAAALANIPKSEWGCELSDEKVLQGINAGLIAKEWAMTDRETKGQVVAKIVVRSKHTLIVDIAYTNKAFDITYRSSDNLNYKVRDDGTTEIHKNVNKWMETLRKHIAKQLSGLCSL